MKTRTTIAFAALMLSATLAGQATAQCQGEYVDDFAISNGEVTPDAPYYVSYQILGAEITFDGTYDVPVTCEIEIGGSTFTPFGALTDVLGGNVNVADTSGLEFVSSMVAADSPLSLTARSWELNSGDGSSPSDWIENLTISTSENTPNMLVLRDGDSLPAITPFLNQASIADILIDYVNFLDNTIQLEANQAIYLLELGTTDLTASNADFQDLVVLVTLADDPIYFSCPASAVDLFYD